MFTICIPVFNRAKKVKPTLDSILAQTYRPLNVILVDNNSSDDTFSVLSQWKAANESDEINIRLIQESLQGPSSARNAALSNVETEWTLFFDSDDVMPPNHLEKIKQTILKYPEVEVIGWDRKTIRNNKSIVYKKFVLKDFHFENITHSILSTLSYTARTEIFRKAGGWNNYLRIGEDIELGSRIIALTPKISYIQNHFVTIYEGDDSLTNNQKDRAITLWNTLIEIKKNLPDKNKHWPDFHMVNSAATWAKNDPQSKVILKEIYENTHLFRRFIWKLFYLYGKLGGKGAAYIYRILSLNTLKL